MGCFFFDLILAKFGALYLYFVTIFLFWLTTTTLRLYFFNGPYFHIFQHEERRGSVGVICFDCIPRYKVVHAMAIDSLSSIIFLNVFSRMFFYRGTNYRRPVFIDLEDNPN